MRRSPLVLGLALSLSLALSPTAHARPDLGLPSTPFTSDTLVDDGTSIFNNPANAVFQPGLEAGLGMRLTEGGYLGDGYYGYGSWTARFGLNLSGAFAVRSAADPGVSGAASIAWGSGPIALGLRYRVYSHDKVAAWNGLSTSDIGVTLRPANALALSFVLENLWNPSLAGDLNVGRGYRIGVGTRTLKGHLMVGVSAGFYPNAVGSHADYGLELRSQATDTLALYVAASARYQDGGFSQGIGLSGGLSFRFNHLLVDAALHRALTGGDGFSGGWGGAGLIRHQSQPRGHIRGGDDLMLRVQLRGDAHERPARGLFTEDRPAWVDTLMELRRVRDDDRFAGVYVHLSATSLGVAQLWELRQALDALRARGKRIVVYIEKGGIRDLYIAAAGDLIMASPAFTANDAGLRVERFYIGDLLERIGVQAQFLRVGEYKSAVEMFTRGAPSEESDEALHAYLRTVWQELSGGICRGRASSACPGGHFPFHEPIHADSLLASGWIQRVGYEDELPLAIRQELGRTLRPITWEDAEGPPNLWRARPHIGVIHVTGMILDGGSGSNPLTGGSFTGEEGVEAAVRAALNDPKLAGLIVRVSSPGGSAFASDEMLRALELVRRAGIPIRVSMGDEAASGGYYVSAFRTKVFAAPTTLTGSIGIYAGTFAVDDLLSRFGVHREATPAGGSARLFSGRAWSEEDMVFMQASLDAGYRRFVTLVAQARGMSFEDADAVARGRIWSGADAKSAQLVDEIGSFLDAYDDLCATIDACRREPLALFHYDQDRRLPFPTPFATAAQAMGAESMAGVGSLLEALGLRGVLARLVQLAPGHAGEHRLDVGGVIQLRFQ